MTTRDRDNNKQAEKPRDQDFIGAEVAIQRAAGVARRRAMENLGSVAVFKGGKVVWETAEGKLLDEPEQYTESQGNPSRNLGEIPKDIGESP